MVGPLLLFTTVKNLFLSKIFSPRMLRIALALQGFTSAHWEKSNGSVARSAKCSLAGVPGSGICPGGIAEFISARQVRSPITLSPFLPGIENSTVNSRRG
jgi:hypothetical protein